MAKRARSVIRPLPPARGTPPAPVPYRGDMAVAHAAILAYGLGILIAGLIAYLRDDESEAASFQAAQALVWQLLYVLVTLGIERLGSALLLVGTVSDALGGTTGGIDTALLCTRGLLVLAGGPFIVLGLVGAWRVWHGHPFRYPLVGGLVARWYRAP